MVLLGVVPFDEALRGAINWETILLLLGMMISRGLPQTRRFFEFVSTLDPDRAASPRGSWPC